MLLTEKHCFLLSFSGEVNCIQYFRVIGMTTGPWEKSEISELCSQLERLNARLLKVEDVQEEMVTKLTEINKSQINTSKIVSKLGTPLWALTFLALAAFWKAGWAHKFWYDLVSFF